MKTTPIPARRLIVHLIAAALALAAGRLAALSPPHEATIDAASAAVALSQSWRIADDATVEVHNVRGSVTVSAGNAGEASLSGELGAGSKLVVDGSEKHLELRVESIHGGMFNNNNDPKSDSDLVLKLPANVALSLELVSADGRVSGIAGKSLEIDCVSGKLTIESGAAQAQIDSVSGDVIFTATRPSPSQRIDIETVSGDIELTGASGRVKLDTVSGRARASGKEIQEFESGTVSGDVELAAALGRHGRVEIQTMSGNIAAEVPADVSARIAAETFSGRIRSDFGNVSKPEYGPGSNLDATVGGGDAQISTKSFSGNVEIRKRP
jgi:hypothetical protein